MAKSPPSLEAIVTQLREFSKAKGSPITEKEWNHHLEHLCGGTTVRHLFEQSSWHDVLRDCGITPRHTSSPTYVAHWILAFYAEQGRWPMWRDFKRPCSHWVVKRVFQDAENAVAAAVQLAKDTLKTLEAQGVVLTEYLKSHFITVQPQRLPSTASVLSSARFFGTPTGFELFPYAPTCENGVLVLFGILVGSDRLKPRFLVESVAGQQFPDCRGKRYVPGRKAYTDVAIEFELRSADYLTHGHPARDEPCDYLICWENDWPVDVARPRPQILALAEVLGVGRR
jgi:hypothetical protein